MKYFNLIFLFRLPQDIYQTAKVAKILLLLEKGKGKEFKGKNLNDIEFNQEIYYSSESEQETEETGESISHIQRCLPSCSTEREEVTVLPSQTTESSSACDQDLKPDVVINGMF